MNALRYFPTGILIVLVGSPDARQLRAEPPQAIRVGEKDQKAFQEGIEEAEQFRRSLLKADAKGNRPAILLSRAIARFPATTVNALRDRPAMGDFTLTEAEVLKRIEGTEELKGAEAFGAFRGRWYGVWDKWKVDHDWADVTSFKPPKRLSDANGLGLRAVQYAWIGDGFGWNVVAVPTSDKAGDVILGSVYHLADGDPKRVRSRQPHVGMEAGKGRLIWLTKSEVFFEEVVPDKTPNAEKYVISGFRYRLTGAKLIAEKSAFQAVYTRDNKTRPPFFHFDMDFSVE